MPAWARTARPTPMSPFSSLFICPPLALPAAALAVVTRLVAAWRRLWAVRPSARVVAATVGVTLTVSGTAGVALAHATRPAPQLGPVLFRAEPRVPALRNLLTGGGWQVASAPEPAPAPAPAAAAETTPAPVAAPAPTPPPPPPPAVRPDLPSGKGVWIWQPQFTENGDAAAIVAKAKANGLTHLYVRIGSSWDGFNGVGFVDAVVPAAHAAGLRVYGWDFPNLRNWQGDVARAQTAITHVTPGAGGQRIDGFAADIETPHEGTHLTPASALAYGEGLRATVGPGYPLIAVVPRPSLGNLHIYPYSTVVQHFDAIAPMIYWLNRQPDSDVDVALPDLAQYGKPLIPVGQAYDGKPEGGRPGVPPPDELQRFMRAAQSKGAIGVSFWVWQEVNQPAWDAIRDAPEFRPPPPPPPPEPPHPVRDARPVLDRLK